MHCPLPAAHLQLLSLLHPSKVDLRVTNEAEMKHSSSTLVLHEALT